MIERRGLLGWFLASPAAASQSTLGGDGTPDPDLSAAERAQAAAAAAEASEIRASMSAEAAATAEANIGAVRLSSAGVLPGNRAAANDARLDAFEKRFRSTLVDGQGQTIPVTRIPEGNRYRNVFWEVENFEGGLTARVAARDTIKVNTVLVTRSELYESWPQDKCFLFKPKGPYNANSEQVLFLPWVKGSGHGNRDMSTSLIRGTPKRLGPDIEHLFQRIDEGAGTGGSTWSAGEVDGQMLMIEREKDVEGTIRDHHLWGRRLHEARLDQQLEVSAEPGDGTVRLTFVGEAGNDTHGLKPGDRFGVSGVAKQRVGGTAISGEYVVKSVVDAHSVVVAADDITGSDSATLAPTRLVFREDRFAEILVDGGGGPKSLSEALRDFDGSAWPTPVTEMHSFGRVPGSDSFWFGLHGGKGNAKGVWIIRVDNLFAGATISEAVQIGEQGVEPTIWHVADDGRVFGAIRSQSETAYPLRIYSYNPAKGGVTLHDFADESFASKCVMSGDAWTGKLVGVVNGTRGSRDGTPAGAVGLYAFIWESFEAFEAGGFDSAESYYIGSDNWTADTFVNSDTSAVGVGSMVVQENGVLCIAGAQENPGTTYDRDGQPDIVLRYVYDLLAPEPHEGAWGSWSSQYANEPPRDPFLYEIVAKVDASAKYAVAPRHSGPVTIRATSGETGLYEIAFVDRDGAPMSLPGGVYNVLALASGAPRYARVVEPTPDGFIIEIADPAGKRTNADFFLTVTHPPVWNLVLS